MAWELLDSAEVPDGLLELYRRDDVFMIRANGLELMNGLGHTSEIAFGVMAAEVSGKVSPNILLGGLGLGYTLAAAAGVLGENGSITVAELSPAVIAWFDRYISASVLPRRPSNVTIVASDIGDLLRAEAGSRYDVIALDVDNGPEALVSPQNAQLYDSVGLRSLAARLTPGGVILLWSAFESPAFVAMAEEIGFLTQCTALASVGRSDLFHYAYSLRLG
ncbi:MAG: spermidine synthase [Rhodospirillaceae bacterium]|nr:spermidine synthase [Rhodospirillaceae bacterium]